MIIFVSLLVAIIGVVMYLGCTNPKFGEIGKLMFFCGLLVTLFNAKGMISFLG